MISSIYLRQVIRLVLDVDVGTRMNMRLRTIHYLIRHPYHPTLTPPPEMRRERGH